LKEETKNIERLGVELPPFESGKRARAWVLHTYTKQPSCLSCGYKIYWRGREYRGGQMVGTAGAEGAKISVPPCVNGEHDWE